MKKIVLMFLVLVMVTGCGKRTESTAPSNSEKKEALQENQYNLVAVDGQKQLITLPEDFTVKNAEENTNVLKAFYRGSLTKPLNLYYFKESDKYSVTDIEQEMDQFLEEYKDLVSLNQGKILSKTKVTSLQAGELTGKYTEVKYSLDDAVSFNAEFYLQNGDYVLHGTLRLDGDDSEKLKLEEFVQTLVQ